jgi:hypothetical protein
VPVATLRALLTLMEGAADLREREIADAYVRGYRDGALDPDLLRATWDVAWATAQDRLAAALAETPDLGPGLAERIQERRAAVDAWVENGGPYPGWAE